LIISGIFGVGFWISRDTAQQSRKFRLSNAVCRLDGLITLSSFLLKEISLPFPTFFCLAYSATVFSSLFLPIRAVYGWDPLNSDAKWEGGSKEEEEEDANIDIKKMQRNGVTTYDLQKSLPPSGWALTRLSAIKSISGVLRPLTFKEHSFT
jgi:hypothetical protein